MQAVRICDKFGNKRTGFELSKNENLNKIFPNGAHVGLKFNIGSYEYEITDIMIDGFYIKSHPRGEFTIDNPNSNIGTHIWISCKTNYPRMTEDGYDEESFKSDLDII